MKPDKHCRKMETLLVSYVHEELDSVGMEKVEEHIKDCDACRCVVDDLKRSKDLVCSLPEVQAPADFLISVRKRLAGEVTAHEKLRPAPSRIFAFLFRPPMPQMALAASFILVFMSAFTLGRYMFPKPGDQNLEPGTHMTAKATDTAESITGTPIEPHGSLGLVSFEGGSQGAAPGLYSRNSLLKPAGLGTGIIDSSAFQQYQTPSEFVQALIRNDPQFRNSEIHPLPQGALILMPHSLLQVTISNIAFMRAQRLVMIKQGKMPNNLAIAQSIYNLKIKSLPHPLLPSE